MELTIVSDLDTLRTYASDWNRLWENCPSATPFQSPEWQLSWWNHFGQGQLRVLVLKEGGSVIGILPLFLYTKDNPPIRTVVLNGTGISDYLDVLLSPDQVAPGMQLIWDYLREISSEWDICDFQEIRSDSPLLFSVNENAQCGFNFSIKEMEVCPVTALTDSYDLWLSSLNRSHTGSLRRAEKLLSKAGDFRIEQADASLLPRYMNDLFYLHESRWGKRNLPGVLREDPIRKFHLEVAAAMLDKGYLRVYRIILNNKTISVLYLFAKGDTTFCYLGGFDPESGNFSPGAIIIGHAMKQAILEGKRFFDFLRGNEAYKYLWGARDRLNYRLVISKQKGG